MTVTPGAQPPDYRSIAEKGRQRTAHLVLPRLAAGGPSRPQGRPGSGRSPMGPVAGRDQPATEGPVAEERPAVA